MFSFDEKLVSFGGKSFQIWTKENNFNILYEEKLGNIILNGIAFGDQLLFATENQFVQYVIFILECEQK